MARNIPASEGLWFGIAMLGRITGILVVTALAGWAFDALAGSSPIGLAVGVVVGSFWATLSVLLTVRKKLASDG